MRLLKRIAYNLAALLTLVRAYRYLFSAVLLCVCGFGQTAKVIPLAAEDSAAIKQALAEQKAADAKLEVVKKAIHDKYLTVEAEREEYSTSGIIFQDITATTRSGSGRWDWVMLGNERILSCP